MTDIQIIDQVRLIFLTPKVAKTDAAKLKPILDLVEFRLRDRAAAWGEGERR